MNKTKKKTHMHPKEVPLPSKGSPWKDVIVPFFGSMIAVFVLVAVWQVRDKMPFFAQSMKPASRTYSNASAIRQELESEIAYTVEPYELLMRMKKRDQSYILYDIRPKASWSVGHIKGAVSLPVREDLFDTRANKKELEMIVQTIQKNKGKEIVLYAETKYSLLPKKMLLYLLEHNTKVRILSVGWTDFRNFSAFWLPQEEWGKTDINQYIEMDTLP